MMKLTDNANKIANYHTHSENYYFKQASAVNDLINDGLNIVDSTPLDYVKINGNLCSDFGYSEGQAVSQKQFEDLLNGIDASGDKRVRQHKNSGYDFTFSAPKTISIAGLVTDKDPRLLEFHDKAVQETMKEIERYYSWANPLQGVEVKSDGMIWVSVKDGFSRENDPQIHTHVIVANLTKYDSKIMALRTRKIMNRDFNKTWGAFYRIKLAQLVKENGHSISYVKGGEWRLDKISHDCEKSFSKRRQQILEEKKKGNSDMHSWRKSRKKKNPKADKKAITNEWQKLAKATNTTTLEYNKEQTKKERVKWIEEAEFVIEASQDREGRKDKRDAEQWILATERAIQTSATTSEEAIIGEYIHEQMSIGNWNNVTTWKDLLSRFNDRVNEGVILKVNGRYTTIDFAITERKYFSWTNKKITDFIFKSKDIKKFLNNYEKIQAKNNKKILSDLQKKAVNAILADDSFLTIVQGDAGAGKTTMLHAVNEILKEKGINVKGLAMQGVASKNLETESGIPSSTITSYLRAKGNHSKRVLVLDEASMLDSRSALKLFEKAYKEGSRLILVGDRNQLESIQAGSVFNRLVNNADKEEKLINLSENFRQRDPELYKAVMFARDGNMKESLDILDKKGKIHEELDAHTRRNTIAKHYDKETLIISGTTAGKTELNTLIREKLIKEKKIVEDGHTYNISIFGQDGNKKEYDLSLSKGDCITFTKNEYKYYDIRNGERGTIIDLTPITLKIELEDKRIINLNLKEYSNIDYGYALTTYKSQGLTFNKVVIDSDTRIKSLQDMRHQYVNITRARDDVKIFTDDKGELKELSEKKSTKRDTLDEAYDLNKLVSLKNDFENKMTDERLAELKTFSDKSKSKEHALEH